MRNLDVIVIQEKKNVKEVRSSRKHSLVFNIVNIDTRIEEAIYGDEHNSEKPLHVKAKTKIHRLVPGKYFVSIQLDNNPTRTIKIGANL